MNAAIEKIYSSHPVRNQEEYHLNKRSEFLSANELNLNIQGCVLNDRLSQKKIYTSFYNYAMTICSLYTDNYDDSVEILNDGFLKVFKEVNRYKPVYADMISSFKGWLRKIIIYTAIDHFRKNHKHRFTKELDSEVTQVSAGGEDALDRISYNEIIRSMRKLTPGYRIIFNLFIIENFSHEEISKQLGISIGTSKSNLARGRKQLQKLLLHQNQIKIPKRIEGANSSRGVKVEMGLPLLSSIIEQKDFLY
jgi:RNA polymerase sigma-70 factor (ECF subfamily)